MIIPNEPMAGFKKHKLKIPSPSTINEYVGYKSKWCLRKIFGYTFPTDCKMMRGTCSDKGAGLVLEKKNTEQGAVVEMLKQFDEKCNESMKDYDKERKNIKKCIEKSVDELTKTYGNFLSFQSEVVGVIGGYKYHGYTDFIFQDEKTGKKVVVDLKTTLRTPSQLKSAHARQISLYSHALGCDAVLLYIIPLKDTTKAIWWEVSDKQKYLDECVEILKSMDLLLYNCNDKYEVAKMCYPNADDFFWSEPEIEARKKVWGI